MPPQLGTYAPPANPARCHQILIVEDNPDQALTLKVFLSMRGHRLEIAGTGPAAVEAARRLRPDVVLLDLGLPGFDGFEVARRLRQEHGERMRIIVVSAYASDDDRRLSREAGCELHLVKPADPRFIESLLG